MLLYSLVVLSDSSTDEGLAVALRLALRMSQSATERAPQLLYSPVQWVGGVVHDGGELDYHSPVAHLLHRVQGAAQDGAGPPDQLVFLSRSVLPRAQHTAV